MFDSSRRERIHVEEFKVRLTEPDAELLRALARRRGIAPAVVLRAWARSELHRMGSSLPDCRENRRPA